MYFLKFNNKITRTISLVTFCFLHWNSHLCLTNGLLLTSKTLLYMLRTELYRKASKDFEATDFHCYISNNTYFPFLLKSFKEIPPPPQKKKKFSVKVETFSKQNGICRRYLFTKRIMYIKLQSYSLY